MAHTTLARTDRALEKIGEFVALQDYPSLKAVGRTFAQKAAVLVGLRRSIPKRYAKKAKRRLPAVNSHAKALGSLAEPYLLRVLREDLANASPVESLVGEERMLHEESVRCACAADAQGFANLRGLYHHLRHKATFDCCPIGANPCHLVMFRALAERVAMARASVPSELVEDLENDFPRLMEQRRGLIRDDAATVGP